MEVKDQIVYIVLNGDQDMIKRLSINEWNDIITRYENEPNAIVEDYDAVIKELGDKFDGYCFITTTLKTVIEKQKLSDLRFMYEYRTEGHLTDPTQLKLED